VKQRNIAIFLLCFITANGFAVQSVFSKQEIPPSCEKSYARGVEFFNQTTKDGLSEPEQVKAFDEAYAKELDDCRFYWSVGLFDAKHIFQKNINISTA